MDFSGRVKQRRCFPTGRRSSVPDPRRWKPELSEILIIGFGSIGARHARIARSDGHEVTVVSRRGAAENFPCSMTVTEALSRGRAFHFAIVASETGRHGKDVRDLIQAGFTGRILVEKPVFSGSAEAQEIAADWRGRMHVAYNLRFHPLLIDLRQRLRSAGRVLNVVVHVGQDLHQWRAGRPPEQTYSSRKSGGGGVLRDLSHELDYLIWLFGPWRSVHAAGGRLGELAGDADDSWGILMRFESGAMVTLAMDYFCRSPVRSIVVNTTKDTLILDLIRGVLSDAELETCVRTERDFTYQAQLRALVAGENSLCDFEQGVEVLRLVEAIEESSARGREVVR